MDKKTLELIAESKKLIEKSEELQKSFDKKLTKLMAEINELDKLIAQTYGDVVKTTSTKSNLNKI